MDDALAAFLSVCPEADHAVATAILQNHDLDVERAVGFFFEAGPDALQALRGAGGGAGAGAADAAAAQAEEDARAARALAAQQEEEQVRAPIAQTRGVLVDDGVPPMMMSAMRTRMRQQPQVEEVFRDYAGAAREGAGEQDHRPNLSDLFRPPHDLIYLGSFMEAKDAADADKKWMLVNIQKRDEFDSQRLNRDTWSDEALKALVKRRCVFWQIQHELPDAQQFLNYYRVEVHDLPCIALIDPRTGERVKYWTKFVAADKLSDELEDVFARIRLDSFSAVAPAPTKRQRSDFDPMVDDDDDDDVKMGGAGGVDMLELDEDAQLAAAIAASMQDAANIPVRDTDGDVAVVDAPAPAPAPEAAPAEPSGPKRTELPKDAENAAKAEGAEATLRIRMPSGEGIVVRFTENDTLETVYQYVADFLPGGAKFHLMQGMPRMVFARDTNGHQTLKEADLFPRAALSVKLDE